MKYTVEGKTGGGWVLVSQHRSLKAATRAAHCESRRGCLPSYPNWPARIVKHIIVLEIKTWVARPSRRLRNFCAGLK